jgi:YVTN family beta-propeller protein
VQVAPNGKSVWVTANLHGHHGHAEAGHEEGDPVLDQVIVIDPAADTIVQRIGVAAMAHLSHVVIAPDGRTAYVNAQNQNRIYRIDAEKFQIQGFTGVSGQGPHGIRLAPDGRKAYLAMLQGRSLGIMDTVSRGMTYVPLGGAAVQAGVTPDGKIAMASIYDTKRLALYEVNGGKLSFVDLPAEAKGPVQLYPTPDSRFVYLADQGFYFDQPVGDKVYKIDLGSRQVVKTIAAGQAPHGVVVSSDGGSAFVTNLLSDDVSVIDTDTDQEAARIPVGKEPNGISLWSAGSGGTP